MILTKRSTPEIYYNRSRDFQLLGRIYDIIFNYMRTGALKVKDSTLNRNTSDELIDLISYTLGFKYNPKYNIKQLRAICSIFMLAIKNKGSLLSIELAVYAILHSANISTLPGFQYVPPKYITEEIAGHDVKVLDPESYTLIIRVPAELKDLSLLTDVLEYILPAGIKCTIYRKSAISAETVVDVYNDISDDNIADKTIATGSYVSIIPIPGQDYVADIKQADLGPYRNDSMVTPTNKDPESIIPPEGE